MADIHNTAGRRPRRSASSSVGRWLVVVLLAVVAASLVIVATQSAAPAQGPGDATRQLRLVAARTFIYDRRLESYNTQPPPSEIADLVRRARRSTKATTQP